MGQDQDPIPAWEIPKSPLDGVFRQRFGGYDKAEFRPLLGELLPDDDAISPEEYAALSVTNNMIQAYGKDDDVLRSNGDFSSSPVESGFDADSSDEGRMYQYRIAEQPLSSQVKHQQQSTFENKGKTASRDDIKRKQPLNRPKSAPRGSSRL